MVVISGGDCISLVTRILDVKPIDAVRYLDEKLVLNLDFGTKVKSNYGYVNPYEERKKARQRFKEWENNKFIELCDELHDIKKKYEKKCEKIVDPDEFLEDNDVLEYYEKADKLQYCIDLLIYGTEEDALWLKNKWKGG